MTEVIKSWNYIHIEVYKDHVMMCIGKKINAAFISVDFDNYIKMIHDLYVIAVIKYPTIFTLLK